MKNREFWERVREVSLIVAACSFAVWLGNVVFILTRGW